MTKTMAEVLDELWDAGNCTGLDGWIGPGRGAAEVDDDALRNRERDVSKALAALSAAGYGLVADAKREAVVIHVPHDMEAHDRSFNEGYETAVAQELSDDPTTAQEWLDDKLRGVKAEALEEAAQALPFMDRPVTRLVRHVAVARWLRSRAAEMRQG